MLSTTFTACDSFKGKPILWETDGKGNYCWFLSLYCKCFGPVQSQYISFAHHSKAETGQHYAIRSNGEDGTERHGCLGDAPSSSSKKNKTFPSQKLVQPAGVRARAYCFLPKNQAGWSVYGVSGGCYAEQVQPCILYTLPSAFLPSGNILCFL